MINNSMQHGLKEKVVKFQDEGFRRWIIFFFVCVAGVLFLKTKMQKSPPIFTYAAKFCCVIIDGIFVSEAPLFFLF